MIRTTITAAALAIAAALAPATPAMAETWVTYRVNYGNGPGGDGKHRTYQLDVASIANHRGWTHVNHRICLDHLRDCRATVSYSAQCGEGRVRSHDITYTRRNGDEWWYDYEIKRGRRFVASTPAVKAARDRANTALFSFLCEGES